MVTPTLMNHDGNGDARIKTALELLDKYAAQKFTLGIHGLYTSDEEYIKKAADLAREKDMIVHMHFCETKDEAGIIKERYSVSNPGEVLEKYFGGLKCVLAHCVKLSDYDKKVIAKQGISVSHCPVSNLMLGCGTADISTMHEMGVNVSLRH